MKTRIEAFIERLAMGSSIDELNHDDNGLDQLSRMIEHMGNHELAKEVYSLYVEAYMIYREMKHQQEKVT